MTKQTQRLFSEFEPSTKSDWLKLIKADFPDKTLADFTWHSPERIDVEPVYTADDMASTREFGLNAGWLIQDRIDHPSIDESRQLIANGIKNEVTDFSLVFDYLPDGIRGINIQNKTDLINLLDLTDIEKIRLHIRSNAGNQLLFKYLDSFCKTSNIKADQIQGSLQFDPYYQLLTQNHVNFNYQEWSDSLAQFLNDGKTYKQIRKLVVDGRHFKSASADCISELVFTLSTLIDYLDALTDRKFNIDNLVNELSFNLAIGPNFCFEIAKFRTFRLLAGQILKDYGAVNPTIDICAVSGDWNKTTLDSHSNLLRNTSEAISAALGGADRIELSRFDYLYNNATEFSQRLSRNIQHLLKSESHLDMVDDSAAGSYYIEYLSNTFIDHAWKRINEINTNGGFFKQIQSGKIQNELKSQQGKIQGLLTDQKAVLIGVNKYHAQKQEKLSKRDKLNPYSTDFKETLDFKSHPIAQLDMRRASVHFEEAVK